MVDVNKIKYQFNLLDKYYHKLKEKQNISKEEFLNNTDIQAIVERNSQLAIERCLNIGTHLIAALPLEYAEDYGIVSLRLARAKITLTVVA
ncbi:MAG: HepT-like ribonuclease domain-containing protein [Candidatus Aminicenantia bacterium]